MNVTEIQRRIQNARSLDFGTIFNQAIELFKKVWVQGLVTVLLNMVLAIPLVMIIYIPLLFMGLADAYSNPYDSYDPYYSQPDINPFMMLMMFILYLIAIFGISVIGIGLKSAFYRICKLKDLEEMGKEDYFYFLKKPYFGKTVKLGLAYMGITIIGALLCVVPLIYAIVPLSYMFVVYAFNPDKSVSEIVKLSFEIGNKKWLITFGLMIVSGLLAGIVGLIMCGVGVYLTMSFTFLPQYLIYKDVVGFDDDNENLQIAEDVTF